MEALAEDSFYSRFSNVDKKNSHSLMFDALKSKHFEFVPELVAIGIQINITNEVGVS